MQIAAGAQQAHVSVVGKVRALNDALAQVRVRLLASVGWDADRCSAHPDTLSVLCHELALDLKAALAVVAAGVVRVAVRHIGVGIRGRGAVVLLHHGHPLGEVLHGPVIATSQ
ncbi:hypothetical protein Pcac1_g1802 [Phytophthora cactorum]|nr:hypothetical protein Pcac1_g1802 [Phytophthora cactorum]